MGVGGLGEGWVGVGSDGDSGDTKDGEEKVTGTSGHLWAMGVTVLVGHWWGH